MIKKRIINAILEWLKNSKVIQKDEYDKYQYVLEIIWIMIVPFIMMIPISFMTKITYEGFVLLSTFSLLRRICGGYHFAKEGTCYVASFFLLIDIILIGKKVNGKGIILTLLIFSFISICLFSFIMAKLQKRNEKILNIVLLNFIIGIIEFVFELVGKDKLAKWTIMGSVMTAILQYPVIICESVLWFRGRHVSR